MENDNIYDIHFKNFKEKIIKMYEESKEIDDLEKFETVENIKFICKNFYIRTEKSEHKKEIFKWFSNIVDYGCGYFGIPSEVINSMSKSLELDTSNLH